MIEMFFIFTAIFVIGLFIYEGLKSAAKATGKWLATPPPSENVKGKPKDIRICEDEWSLRRRKRYLEETKESWYERGEGERWEECMKDVVDKLGGKVWPLGLRTGDEEWFQNRRRRHLRI